MAFKKIYEGPDKAAGPACLHLRSKAMFVTGDMDPSHIDVESMGHHCWCNKTQHVFGPDRADVERHLCTEGRPCFESIL